MTHDPSADDPRFPNRPKHLDFMRLSQVVQEVDRLAEVQQVPVEEIVGVDMASLIYTLEQRLGTFSQRTGQDLRGPVGMTLWLDGFTAGKRFAEAKAEAISDEEGS